MAGMSCLQEWQNGQGCVRVRALCGVCVCVCVCVCVRTCAAAGLALACGGSCSKPSRGPLAAPLVGAVVLPAGPTPGAPGSCSGLDEALSCLGLREPHELRLLHHLSDELRPDVMRPRQSHVGHTQGRHGDGCHPLLQDGRAP